MGDEVCGSCMHFRVTKLHNDIAISGLCHRYPAYVSHTDVLAGYQTHPHIMAQDYCGEWQSARHTDRHTL